MTEQELLALAQAEGFHAALLEAKSIPVNPAFRAFCQENVCGKYGSSYACPPECGTAEALEEKIRAEETAMILCTQWSVESYEDTAAIRQAEKGHNAGILRLMEALRRRGYRGFAAGCHGCPLCGPCKLTLHEPCPFPEERILCLSACCVDVAQTARLCGLEYSWDPGTLYLYGMVCLHRTAQADKC